MLYVPFVTALRRLRVVLKLLLVLLLVPSATAVPAEVQWCQCLLWRQSSLLLLLLLRRHAIGRVLALAVVWLLLGRLSVLSLRLLCRHMLAGR